MVAGLLGGELGHRREDAVRIARKHDNIARLAVDDARDACVVDKINGVRAARVLRDADVVVVGMARCRVVDNILEDGAEADGIEDLGLLLSRKVDALRITAALNVEHARVGPNVLVVTDELTAGVRGERAARGQGRREDGFGDTHVLPVPDRPKKSVTSPLSMPTLADEWRESWPNLTGWR